MSVVLSILPKVKDRFVVTLPLMVNDEDHRIMVGRLEAGKRIFNAVLGDALSVLQAMRSSSLWEEASALPKGDPKRTAAFKTAVDSFDFKKSRFDRCALVHRRDGGFSDRVGSPEAQKLGERAFGAVFRYSVGKGGKPRFKGYTRPLHSLEGKSNAAGLRWKREAGSLFWNGLVLRAKLPKEGRNLYLSECLACETAYCRIVRREVGRKTRWYLQLIQKGQVPLRRKVNISGEVGLDHGPSQLAVLSDQAVGLEDFAAGVEQPWDEMRKLQRAQDRSRRAMNPENFDEVGRCRPGPKVWATSSRYESRAVELRNLEAKLSGRRKTEHGNLINRILALGCQIRVEEVSHVGFQKMFGRSVKVRGPGMFVEKLTRKAESAGGEVVLLDTWGLKLSQYCHVTDSCVKKPLSQRFQELDRGTFVQRDVYSAFLARHVNGRDKLANSTHLKERWAATELLLSRAGLVQTQPARGKLCFPTVALPPSEPVARRTDGTRVYSKQNLVLI